MTSTFDDSAAACTTTQRQSYGPFLFQHADSGNWQKLTIPCMVGDCRSSSSRITPTASHSVATAHTHSWYFFLPPCGVSPTTRFFAATRPTTLWAGPFPPAMSRSHSTKSRSLPRPDSQPLRSDQPQDAHTAPSSAPAYARAACRSSAAPDRRQQPSTRTCAADHGCERP